LFGAEAELSSFLREESGGLCGSRIAESTMMVIGRYGEEGRNEQFVMVQRLLMRDARRKSGQVMRGESRGALVMLA
jgi:hypothetical protein